MIKWCIQALLLLPFAAIAQSYEQKINEHRYAYKMDFISEKNSPLQLQDLDAIAFFEPDEAYKVEATFTAMEDKKGFIMETHSGKQKQYYKYGKLSFTLKGKPLQLYVYYSKDVQAKEGLSDYLFIPFNDSTNSVSTFGGGRYIDLRTGDIANGKVTLDFNKCYNPYCAYAAGYSCPIPPSENKLKASIFAGEKMYIKGVVQDH